MGSKIAPGMGGQGRQEARREGQGRMEAGGWWEVHPCLTRQGPFRAPRSPAPQVDSQVGFQTLALCTWDPCLGHPDTPLSPLSAFSAGIILAGLLTLGAVLSAAATVREAGGLMAGVSSLCPQLPQMGSVRAVSPRRLPLPCVPTETEAPGMWASQDPSTRDSQGPSTRDSQDPLHQVPISPPSSMGALKGRADPPRPGHWLKGPGRVWFCDTGVSAYVVWVNSIPLPGGQAQSITCRSGLGSGPEAACSPGSS